MAAGTSDRHEEETTPEDERPAASASWRRSARPASTSSSAPASMYSVFVRTLYYTFARQKRAGRRPAADVRDRQQIRVLPDVTMGFIGMILVYQSGLQAKRVVPDLTLLGATYLELLVRDLAASIGALMLATRVGAGIAAEIGSMVVTEQIDALRMCAADPIDFSHQAPLQGEHGHDDHAHRLERARSRSLGRWSPRSSPSTSPLPHLLQREPGRLRRSFDRLAKCVAYGAAIPIVSGYCGLSTFGGSEGVGWATTRAVVNTSLAIIMLNFFISAAGFIIFPG
jgi:phospholipid/cholesterol/gamma-HCH transport system permease protein